MSSTLTLPGLIDCHVHFREPGLIQKGDMQTESRAALAGGVTTVCEMPNTIPATTTIEALQDKVERAEQLKMENGKWKIMDIRFFFGVTDAAHLRELEKLWSDPQYSALKKRCAGVKLYFDHSTGNQKASHEVIEEAFNVCASLKIPVVAHCEDAEINADLAAKNTRTDVNAHSDIRPPESEEKAVAFAIDLAAKYGTQFHVAHLSTKQGLDLVRKAKKRGLPVTCEVAPHHLFLSVDDYETLGTLGKMNPPLRTRDHCEALWEGIADGTVDCIATDHAPHTLEEKTGVTALQVPSGVTGVETMLPLLLTVAAGKWPHPEKLKMKNGKLEITDIVRLCFENPNRIFSLGKKAGDSQVVIDPNEEWIIRGKELHSKCGWTPYEGWKVQGKVVNVL